MTKEWAAAQWTIRCVNVLKSQEAYKVSIEYSKVWLGGKDDSISGYLWRTGGPNWKPTGVTWFLPT